MNRPARFQACSVGLLALACVIASGTIAVADVLPYGVKIEKVLDNGSEHGDLEQSPTGELWLLERDGTLRVLHGGVETATLALTVSAACEGGLLDVAFAPDFTGSGRALVYYIDAAGEARVDEVFHRGGALTLGQRVLDLGSANGGCTPGGGLAVGPDGKLYVSVGDLGTPGSAQDDISLAGKVLRAELDGSVPADNPSGTLVWAKGFRDGHDLAINPATARPNGTLYLTDHGETTATYDEINAVAQGGNHGWSATSGPDPGYDDPLTYYTEVTPEAIEVFSGARLGADFGGSLVYACSQADDVRQAYLTGAELDTLDYERVFYDPDGDRDGTPDAGCPHQFNSLTEGGDGWLYGANAGANPGVWRVWNDGPGPREVSAPGSPFEMTLAKNGASLDIGWENLGSLDAGRPSRNAGQHPTTYQVWEGALPIDGTYDHTVIYDTDGLADGPGRLTATITGGSGSHYYLIGAQGDNLEGPLGLGRPGPTDYCDTLGWGTNVGQCAKKWVSPVDGSELYLTDYNPSSPTYLQQLTMSDFRGQVVRMDISADNCFWCGVQADLFHDIDLQFRDRDLRIVTVFMLSYLNWSAVPPAQCATLIADWASVNGETNPILCDTDLDGNGRADVAQQYDFGCGTPSNYYIDQGHVVYEQVCGAELSAGSIVARVVDEVNPESCE